MKLLLRFGSNLIQTPIMTSKIEYCIAPTHLTSGSCPLGEDSSQAEMHTGGSPISMICQATHNTPESSKLTQHVTYIYVKFRHARFCSNFVQRSNLTRGFQKCGQILCWTPP